MIGTGGLALLTLLSACGGKTSEPPHQAPQVPDAIDATGTIEMQRAEAGEAERATESAEEQAIENLKQAGYRRGLHLCSCYDIPANGLPTCAREESGPARRLFDACVARCVASLARAHPQVTDFLVCQAERALAIATCESKVCPIPQGCGARDCDSLPEDLQRSYDDCLSPQPCDAG
jgi:hypothetical protein